MAFSSTPIANNEARGVNGGTSPSADTTGANLLVLSACWYNGTTTDVTVSDSKSNLWTPLTKVTESALSARIWYCAGPTVGSGHTFTVAGSGTFAIMHMTAWSGAHATPFDSESGASNISTTSQQPGSVAPLTPNSLLITSFGFTSVGVYTVNSSYTISDRRSFSSGASEGGAQAYLLMGSPSFSNPTWSTGGGAGTAIALIAIFKSANTTTTRGMPFGRGTAFNGGRTLVGPLMRGIDRWALQRGVLRPSYLT